MLKAIYQLNNEQKGVEIYFNSKPETEILDTLKKNKFRWNGLKKCWYSKQSESSIKLAESITSGNIEVAVTAQLKATKADKKKLAPLFDRVKFEAGTTDKSQYHWHTVGSNYTGLSVKETAAEIRKILKARFPEVKFSVTSDYNSINLKIIQSPYDNKKLEYDRNREPAEYRVFEKANNKEINAILEYCNRLLKSYNWDDSDSMTDYFNSHFYGYAEIHYDYIQAEQTEEVKADIEDFRNKLIEEEKAEQERRAREWEQRQKEMEAQELRRQERDKEIAKETEIINSEVEVKKLTEQEEYFILDAEFAHLNKNCRLEQYKEEVAAGEYYLQDVKVVKEIHFKNAETLEYFNNMLLHDFDFLEHEGGSYTEDKRINSMTDYYNMTRGEQETVKFNLVGVAVYLDGCLQYVIDPQGFSYARYVGLTENATVTSYYKFEQVINDSEVEALKAKADTVEDISVNIIIDNDFKNTWDAERFEEYKALLKAEFKEGKFKLSKSIIRQLSEDSERLKVALYKILTEIDSIQEQFKEADLQQGQKVTLFYIGDFANFTTSRIIIDKVEPTTYAQHENAIKLTFKPENKRNLYYNYFYSNLLVYDGWLDLPETVLNDIEERNGFTITKSKFTSCDKQQFDEILKHFEQEGQQPIINTYRP